MKHSMLAIVAVCLLCLGAEAQNKQIPLIGSEAPSFKAMSTQGNINFPKDFGNSWKILFSHPSDFTPVCSTELLEMANLQPQFNRLGVKVAVISTDNVETHKLWVKYLNEVNYKNRGPVSIQFPLIEDPDAVASNEYGMLHQPTSSSRDIRGVFIIDSKNIVRAINFYPLQVGRNMDEILRLVEALQVTDGTMVYTPANWKKGDDVIVPFNPLTREEARMDVQSKDGYYQVGNRIWFMNAQKLSMNEK